MKSHKTDKKTWLGVAMGLALALLTTSPRTALAQQWTTNGNNISNANTGNVGIGTSSPGRLLHILDTSNFPVFAGARISTILDGSDPVMEFLHQPANKGFRWRLGGGSPSNFYLDYSSNGFSSSSVYLTVLSTGNIGIGTTAPAALLTLQKDQATGTEIRVANNNTAGFAGLYLNSGFTQASGGLVQWNNNPGFRNLFVTTGGADPLYLGTENSIRLTVQPTSGNIGIGTTAPAAKLHIVSGTDNPNTLLSLDTGVHGGSQFQIGGTTNNESYFNLNVYRAGLYFTRLSVSNFGHLLLQPSGDSNVGIGTTGPSYKLDVQGGQINASGGLCIAGDCKTAWSQVGGEVSSQWTTSGSSIYYNTGKVGIGTNAPLGPLSVGNSAVPNSDGYLVLGKHDGSGARQFRVGFDSSFNFVIGDYGNNNTAGSWLSPFAINWQAPNNSLYINSTGNVGIGTGTPTAKLHVAGDGKVTGNLIVDGNIAAKYQDVAEWVPASELIPIGTVVVLDSTKSNHVIASTQTYDTRVAGVISEQPGIALGESGKNKVLVATTGRVRIKVDATRSPINIGDLLVTSDKEGVAMKSEPINIGGVKIHRPGTLIGKALEPLAKGQGEILVLLSLQ